MLREFAHLTDKLNDPEYLHLLLEPLMVWGLAIGVLVFLFSFFFSERKMQLVGLGLIIASCLIVIPYLKQRKKSDERVVKLRGDMKEMIVESAERRKDSRAGYMVVAALAGLTILMGAHKGKPGMLAGMGTAVAGVIVVIHGTWLDLKDAEIYHPNIRVVEGADYGGSGDKKSKSKEKSKKTGREYTQPVSSEPKRPQVRKALPRLPQ